MATWNSRGLRGSGLEDLINRTNETYANNNLCLIQKIPTPITPVEINHSTRQITLAYFDKKSTVDYIGAVQGIPVCFDAKESKTDTFPLQNVHEHQVRFMKEFEKQQGIAFLIILFTERNVYYYMTYNELQKFWERAENGGRKSIRFEELDSKYFFESKPEVLVPYLDMIQLDLNNRP
ncbi:MAG: Holliday junction resolvase RecU [Lachnospiraceae bacterium]|jgi:recombination protein U|nr:Holliday junction resolvase RecU [Lachnospiraceae bacterium]MBQ4301221.1 Holliday junction resolvase RecU [Lachnospiraceae bacterium]